MDEPNPMLRWRTFRSDSALAAWGLAFCAACVLLCGPLERWLEAAGVEGGLRRRVLALLAVATPLLAVRRLAAARLVGREPRDADAAPAPPPRRPWRRRKRTWAALLLWLATPAVYVAGVGPARYCATRGWLGPADEQVLCRPLEFAAGRLRLRGQLWQYQVWWQSLAHRHEAASD